MNKQYDISLRCFFPGSGNYTQHRQTMELKDIPKWLEAYQFTHPTCESISIKVWVKEDSKNENGK